MPLSIKNLTDCWWQFPPFGKDFHADSPLKNGESAAVSTFVKNGTPLVWLLAGLGA
jgi:hypothetical protein